MSTAPSLDPAERKQRHLFYAQRVQHLTMSLIERTAALAEKAALAPPPEPDTEPATQPAARSATKAAPRPPNHIADFVRLVHVLNQTMALEDRVAGDAPAARAPAKHEPTRPSVLADPRRALLQQAFYDATRTYPDRVQRRREVDRSIDKQLAADPDQTLPALELIDPIIDETGILLDATKVSDELLGMPPRRQYPNPG